MIDPLIITEVRRLLATRKPEPGWLSNRAIARRVGISRGTVDAVANGRRPDYPARVAADDPLAETGPKQRCPTCGGQVFMPCRLCAARAALASATRPPGVERTTPDDLDLQLHPNHQVRYEQIKRSKEAGIDQTGGQWQEPAAEVAGDEAAA